MAKIVGVSGSLRTKSFNTMLLQAATKLMPEGSSLEIASIKEVPLYNGDLEEAEGLPKSVVALKEKIATSDGLLIATPEYNNSVPGVLKNTIDWCTRPISDIPRVFGNRATGIIGATPGPGGTRLSQVAWLPVLRLLNTRPFFAKSLFVSDASKVFDAQGELVDAKIRELLQTYLAQFAQFAANSRE